MPVAEEEEVVVVPVLRREEVSEAERCVWAACEEMERERRRGMGADGVVAVGASSVVPARGSRGAMMVVVVVVLRAP